MGNIRLSFRFYLYSVTGLKMDWSNCGEYLALISFYLYSVTGLKMDWSNCGEYQALISFFTYILLQV